MSNEFEGNFHNENNPIDDCMNEVNVSKNDITETIQETSCSELSDNEIKEESQEMVAKTYSSYHFWEDNTIEEQVQSYSPNSSEDKPSDFIETKAKSASKFVKAIRLVATAIAFGFIAGLSFQGFNLFYFAINNDAVVAFSTSKNDLINKDIKITSTDTTNASKQITEVTKVVDETMPAIVSIQCVVTMTSWDFWGNSFNEDREGSGSGIILAKTDTELLIATNNHVVQGAKEMEVTFIDEKVVKAEIKGTDANSDLAVIAIDLKDILPETLSAIKVAKLGDSENVKVGQMAIAIGNALGYGQSVTVGYISALNREVNVDERVMTLLQTDAAINPGNSGGALLNINGEVVGINAVKYSSSDVEGMGYAIPISTATPIINELMAKETLKEADKGFLGIGGEDITEEISKQLNMPKGVYVTSITENSAAQKAGIIKGDIITNFNGTDISSMEQLREKVSNTKTGTVVKVTILRVNEGDYKEQIIEVTLGSRG